MREEEFISSLSEVSKRNPYRFEQLRACIPLGADEGGGIVAAHREENPARCFHTCVTGNGRSEFIGRLVITLACLYESSEAMFLILSPKDSYAELLRLKSADVTVPYVRCYGDVTEALETLKGIRRARTFSRAPRLFVVADGADELPDSPQGGALTASRNILDVVGGSGGEVITGVDLLNSVYNGYPGAFAGPGNCLVSPSGRGKADVTYVNADSSLTAPKGIVYPDFPTLAETVDFFNSLG